MMEEEKITVNDIFAKPTPLDFERLTHGVIRIKIN